MKCTHNILKIMTGVNKMSDKELAARYRVLTTIGIMLNGLAVNEDGFIRNSYAQLEIAELTDTKTKYETLFELADIVIKLSKQVYQTKEQPK